jgi:hypothetical protein
VGLPATVDVIILCDKPADTSDTVQITNKRMKMAREFPAFSVKLTPVKIPIERNDEGETEEEWMVVANEGTAVPPKEDKNDEDIKLMEAVLRAAGNRATSGYWRNLMQSVTARNGKKGWSDATFDRRLKEFKKLHPELKGGQSQGDPYWLDGLQPTGAMAELMKEISNHPHEAPSNHPHLNPFRGIEGDEGGLERALSTLKPPSEGGEGGSSQGRAEEDLVAPDPKEELARKVSEQLEPVVKSPEEGSDGDRPGRAGEASQAPVRGD